MEHEIPQEKPAGMTVEEMCKAAVAGKIKPSVDLLEKAIGTPWELDLLPDGTVQFKYDVHLDDFKEDCFMLREHLKTLEHTAMCIFHTHPVFKDKPVPPSWLSEMKANLMLAYRHLEDARMRLGKAIQAFDGGKSCYPR